MHLGRFEYQLKSDKFIRIRVGICPSPDHFVDADEAMIKAFLEEDFSLHENLRIIEVINDSEAALRSILTQDIDDVLSRFKLGTPEKDPSAES